MVGPTAILPPRMGPTPIWHPPLRGRGAAGGSGLSRTNRPGAAHRPVADRVRGPFLVTPGARLHGARTRGGAYGQSLSARSAAWRVPVQGQDCWIAIACETDAHWAALVRVMGCPE